MTVFSASLRGLTCMVAFVALALSLTGCLKMNQVMTVMPDGSGKMEMTVGFSAQMLAMSPEDPLAEMTIEKLSEDPGGMVAFTEPEITEEDGYTVVRMTAYFDDINDVESDGPDGTPVSYDLDNGELVISTSVVRSMMEMFAIQGGADALGDPQMKEMIAGMEVSETFVLPGAVTDAEGIESEGNTVSMKVDANMLLNDSVPEVYGEDSGLTISYDAGGVSDADIAAFQAELEAAKANYAELLEAVN